MLKNALGLVLSLFLTLNITWANEQFVKDERMAIQRASEAWAKALNEHHPEKAAALYSNYISLYATYQTKIETYTDLLKYFTKLVAKEDFQVKFNEENIRVYGPTAINSGLYTFTYKKDGEKQIIPARFTLVYTLTPDGWRIVEHHSSTLPE
jgi:hypothetical protein